VLGRGAQALVRPGMLYGLTEVAVKVIKLNDDIAMRDVEDEVRRATRARHRNVVRVFGTVTSPDDAATVSIVMERLGLSLEKAKVSDPAMQKKYTLDIIAGMEHMHRLGQRVVHFDLKRANILLTQDGRSVKIIDFGISQTATTLANGLHAVGGTIPYTAPELFAKRLAQVSAACDVYSFAVVVAELWTGSVAWKRTRKELISHFVKDGQRPFSPDELKDKGVPASIIMLIVACWAQEPERRPSFDQLGRLKSMPLSEWSSMLSATSGVAFTSSSSDHVELLAGAVHAPSIPASAAALVIPELPATESHFFRRDDPYVRPPSRWARHHE
jgi:serine/threonine protein kinase